MKMHYLYILLLVCLSAGFLSCEEDVNDWGYDESYNRLFRSTSFEVGDTEPTAIQLKYKGVTDATKYVFEFSEGDSLEFTNITRIAEVFVDTLTAYSEGTSPVLTEYHVWFRDLKGTTPYSVRMKAVSETKNMESGYSQVYFKTPDEQVFTSIVPAANKAILSWTPGITVTHISYWENVKEGEPVVTKVDLDNAQKEAGQVVVEGLAAGTTYSAQIYNEEATRGLKTFKTLGIKEKDGRTIHLSPAEAGTINDLLANCVAAEDTVVALVFEGDQAYEIETITIPAGITSLYFVGTPGVNGEVPELFLHRINLSSSLSSIIFQRVDLNARLNSSNYVFSLDNAYCFSDLKFEGCTIRNIGRSLVRPNHVDLNINVITIDNSLIQNVGISGYGMINMGKDVAKLGRISITNSTITEFGSDRLLHLKGGVEEVVIDKTTFCNYTSKSSQLFRFDKKPGTITVTNSIFTGNNNGAKINSGNADYSAYLEFYGCFLTSDLLVNTIPFTNATSLSMTSEEMFADPRNGDFHLKEGVRYAGEGKAGDPRWW